MLAASEFIINHERRLVDLMLFGSADLQGLTAIPGIIIIGGENNKFREGLVSFSIASVPSDHIVEVLNNRGIRTHLRKSDHYSGNILEPLGLDSCVRVSMCHYNTELEVNKFLKCMKELMN